MGGGGSRIEELEVGELGGGGGDIVEVTVIACRNTFSHYLYRGQT